MTSYAQQRPIRILQIITRLTTGGDTNVILDIAEYFNQNPAFTAELAVGPVPPTEADLTDWAYQRAIPTTIIPDMVNYISPSTNLAAIRQLRALMHRGRYDIVHTHSSVAGVIGRLAARSVGVPIIVHHVHGWGLQKGMSARMQLIYLTLERLCARMTDRLIAVSRSTIAKGLTYKIAPEQKFALIYNGIPLERFRQTVDHQQVRRALGLAPDSKLVGMIGRLDRQKNPLDFIRAAALVVQRAPNTQFLIAGNGSLRAECEQLIDQLGLQGTFFLLGFRNDIDKIMPVLTMTALSSLWEGLPVVFQEAMSAGKPIVANDVDGASDVIIDGVTGFLVPPEQPDQMAERILRILNDEALCQRMGQQARERSEPFSIKAMTSNIEGVYRQLLNQHRIPVAP